MELPLSGKRRYVVVAAGILLFSALLLLQIFMPKKKPVAAFIVEEKQYGIFSMFRKEEKVFRPIPSGNPTPLPTFTPTPTYTPTPTPTPTNTPTPTPTPTPTVYIPPPAPGELDNYFKRYSGEFSADENLMRKIAACESGYNVSSHNTTFDYAGMYQFSRDTWINTRTNMGADSNPDLRFNAEEAIKTAAFKISRGGQGAWSSCL